jgi:hypothetical protein
MSEDVGLTPLADRIADLALEAARAKKGPRETKRRIAAGVLPILMEARRSGQQAAINALGFHGHEKARVAIDRQIEAER